MIFITPNVARALHKSSARGGVRMPPPPSSTAVVFYPGRNFEALPPSPLAVRPVFFLPSILTRARLA
jgi:hypothetical protein